MTDQTPPIVTLARHLSDLTGRPWYTIGCAKNAAAVQCLSIGAEVIDRTAGLSDIGRAALTDHRLDLRCVPARITAEIHPNGAAHEIAEVLKAEFERTTEAYNRCTASIRRIIRAYRELADARLVEDDSIITRAADRIITRYGHAQIVRDGDGCAVLSQVMPQNVDTTVHGWADLQPKLSAWAAIVLAELRAAQTGVAGVPC